MKNISPLHVLLAGALAVAIVALPMGHILMAIPWLIVVTIALFWERRRGRTQQTFLTYAIVTLTVVVAAVLAPVKTTERVLARPLTLPKTELTIGEMNRGENGELADWLPRYIHVSGSHQYADKTIRFRANAITLREFVDTIETQSNLRHRFMHCGNGSSILYGGDCCFGLNLR